MRDGLKIEEDSSEIEKENLEAGKFSIETLATTAIMIFVDYLKIFYG